MSPRQDRKLGGSEQSQAGYTRKALAAQILVKGQRGNSEEPPCCSTLTMKGGRRRLPSWAAFLCSVHQAVTEDSWDLTGETRGRHGDRTLRWNRVHTG